MTFAPRDPGMPKHGVPFLDLTALNSRHRHDTDRVVGEVMASGTFIGGPFVERFEAEFAAYCTTRHCVGVANGTDALELIMVALGIGPGNEVIVAANTFAATVEAIVTVGATPRFVDVVPDTLLVDPADVAAAIGPRTAAVVAVHLYGQMADLDALGDVTRRHGLALIEDAAQAHGASFSGRPAGSVGVASAFSFYPGKNLGAFGDAGAVVTDDAALADRIRRLANHGRDATDRFCHAVAGRNSRLDALQAAILAVKLPSLDVDNAHRRSVIAAYRERLPTGIACLDVDPRAEPVHHLAVVRTHDRAELCTRLDRHGIGWGLHYPVPCHRQPAFAQWAERRLPRVESAASEILSLPISPTMTMSQVDRVCDALAG